MNTTDAEHILRLRLDLTEARYSKSTIEAWAGSLANIPQTDVIRAMRVLVADGQRDISPAAIHSWLREQRAIAQRAEQLATMNEPSNLDDGCRCQPPQHGLPRGAICDMHRRIGLDNINRIRTQHAHRHTEREGINP